MDKKAFTETAAGKQRTARRQRAERAPRDRRLVWQRMATCVRGLLFAGTGYLFGAAPIAFGACPLGLSLLAASSGYTWYILAGLILSALTQPSSLPAVAVIGVYVFCVLLRLAVLFFVDPPVLPGEAKQTGFRGSLRYAGRYLSLCLQSVGSNLGLETLFPRRRQTDTETDYYTGSPWEKAERGAMQDSEEEDNPESRHTTESLPPPLPDRAGLFSEHPFLRTLTGAVAGFAAGVVGLFEGGFHVYDLLAALLMIFATPVCVVLLTSCFGEAGETLLFSPHPLHGVTGADVPPGGYRRLLSRFRVMPLVACAALALGISFSTRSLSFTFGTPYLTVRLDTLLGILLTLSSVSRLGLVPGLATALLCGIGAGVNRMPLFLLTAAVYAFLRVLSHRSAVIGGSLSGILWCAAYDDMTGFLTQLPAICLSVPVFFLLERLWERMPLSDSDGELAQSDFTLAVTGAVRLAAGQERLGAISQALLEMSDRFGEMAERQRRTGEQQLRQLCRETADAVCAGCPARADCRGVPEDSLLAGLRKRGRVDAAQLAAALPDCCTHREEMAADINSRAARLTEAQVRGGKTDVIAADYAHMASLLADAAEGDPEEETRCNRAAADKVYDYLSSLGVLVQGVVVCGRRQRRVIVRGCRMERLRESQDDLAVQLGRLCGARLMPPEFENRNGCVIMTLRSMPAVEVCYAGSPVPAGTHGTLPPPLTDEAPDSYTPPPVCGDHIAVFRNEQACFYALISDGMGSGEAASAASELCAAFLERMLSAGSHVEISVRMLNSFLCARGNGSDDECSVTVDLMELDTACGHAVFAKNGAAPTYVIRDGTVYKLRSRSLPLGILHDSAPQFLRFRMHPGDVVVMVSDGVTLGNDECPWLLDLLSAPLPDSMDSLRLDILRRAMASGSPDDLSAIAIRLEEPRDAQGA